MVLAFLWKLRYKKERLCLETCKWGIFLVATHKLYLRRFTKRNSSEVAVFSHCNNFLKSYRRHFIRCSYIRERWIYVKRYATEKYILSHSRHEKTATTPRRQLLSEKNSRRLVSMVQNFTRKLDRNDRFYRWNIINGTQRIRPLRLKYSFENCMEF